MQRRYVYADTGTAPVAAVAANGTVTFNRLDRLGSVVAATQGYQVVGQNLYLPHGAAAGGNVLGSAFGFAGYRFDAESGLYHTRTRYYDPRLGRFITPDPIRYGGGINLYAYVGGDPVNGVDPSGLVAYGGGQGFAAGWNGNDSGLWNVLNNGNTAQKVGAVGGLVGGLVANTAAEVGSFLALDGLLGGGSNASTNLYRAVMPTELKSIQNTGAFSNIAGIETKYFSTTLEGAQSYAGQAKKAFGDGPFSYVQTQIPTKLITPEMQVTVDRGISTVTVPTNLLNKLNAPQILP